MKTDPKTDPNVLILAIDLGKCKSVACIDAPASSAAARGRGPHAVNLERLCRQHGQAFARTA